MPCNGGAPTTTSSGAIRSAPQYLEYCYYKVGSWRLNAWSTATIARLCVANGYGEYAIVPIILSHQSPLETC